MITSQGFNGNNLFTYCDNNFANCSDSLGSSWKWLDKLNDSVCDFGRSLGRKARKKYEETKSNVSKCKETILKIFSSEKLMFIQIMRLAF